MLMEGGSGMSGLSEVFVRLDWRLCGPNGREKLVCRETLRVYAVGLDPISGIPGPLFEGHYTRNSNTS